MEVVGKAGRPLQPNSAACRPSLPRLAEYGDKADMYLAGSSDSSGGKNSLRSVAGRDMWLMGVIAHRGIYYYYCCSFFEIGSIFYAEPVIYKYD